MALGNVHQESAALARLARREARPRMDRRDLARVRAGLPVQRDRAPFPCAQVCMACGRLHEGGAAHPHREAADAPLGRCLCGGTAWVDLADEDVARNLAQLESFELTDLHPRRRTLRVAMGLAAAATLLVAAVTALAGAKTYAPLFSTLTCLFALMVVPGYVIDTARELRRRRRKLPWRWALALPPTAREEGPPLARGPARLDGEPLCAPLSGRPCIGYEIRVVRETASDGAAPTLVEQRCADFSVDGRAVPGARTLLRLPARPLEPSALGDREAIVQHYLRRHGLLAEDGPWVLAEAVLELDAEVVVARAAGGGAIVRPGRT